MLRALISLGVARAALGEYWEARALFLDAMRVADEMQDKEMSYTRRWLAFIHLKLGELDVALNFCRVGMRLAAAFPDPNIVASCLGLMAAIHAKHGQSKSAARLAGASAALHARQQRKPWEDSSLDTLLPGWHDGPEHEIIMAAFEAGQAMSSDEAVAFALTDASA